MYPVWVILGLSVTYRQKEWRNQSGEIKVIPAQAKATKERLLIAIVEELKKNGLLLPTSKGGRSLTLAIF